MPIEALRSWEGVVADVFSLGDLPRRGNDAKVVAIAAGGPGFVAVGTTREELIPWQRVCQPESPGGATEQCANLGSILVGAVWTSEDGEAWERVLHDDEVFGGIAECWTACNRVSIHDVTSGDGGLVAIGQLNTTSSLFAPPGMWFSHDGAAWEQRVLDPVVFAPGSILNAVVAGGPGYVIGGSAQPVGGEWDEMTAAIWTSPDGREWSRVDDVGSGDGRTSIQALTVGPGGFVAVGDGGRGGSGIWVSSDGLQWEQVPAIEDLEGVTLTLADVVAGGPGYVAVGWLRGMGRAAVLTSVDGRSWTRVPHDDAVFGGDGHSTEMRSAVAVGAGIVVAGGRTDHSADPSRDHWQIGVVWLSPDGLTWERVADETGAFLGHVVSMNAVAASPTAVVAGGRAEFDAGMWLSRLPSE